MNIKEYSPTIDANTVSDGYHTFGELYEHRCLLMVALMKAYPAFAWRSWKNSNGEKWEGWFVAGLELPSGQITYHLPEKHWSLLNGISELDTGRWDGHTSGDVLERLRKFSLNTEMEKEREG